MELLFSAFRSSLQAESRHKVSPSSSWISSLANFVWPSQADKPIRENRHFDSHPGNLLCSTRRLEASTFEPSDGWAQKSIVKLQTREASSYQPNRIFWALSMRLIDSASWAKSKTWLGQSEDRKWSEPIWPSETLQPRLRLELACRPSILVWQLARSSCLCFGRRLFAKSGHFRQIEALQSRSPARTEGRNEGNKDEIHCCCWSTLAGDSRFDIEEPSSLSSVDDVRRFFSLFSPIFIPFHLSTPRIGRRLGRQSQCIIGGRFNHWLASGEFAGRQQARAAFERASQSDLAAWRYWVALQQHCWLGPTVQSVGSRESNSNSNSNSDSNSNSNSNSQSNSN